MKCFCVSVIPISVSLVSDLALSFKSRFEKNVPQYTLIKCEIYFHNDQETLRESLTFRTASYANNSSANINIGSFLQKRVQSFTHTKRWQLSSFDFKKHF